MDDKNFNIDLLYDDRWKLIKMILDKELEITKIKEQYSYIYNHIKKIEEKKQLTEYDLQSITNLMQKDLMQKDLMQKQYQYTNTYLYFDKDSEYKDDIITRKNTLNIRKDIYPDIKYKIYNRKELIDTKSNSENLKFYNHKISTNYYKNISLDRKTPEINSYKTKDFIDNIHFTIESFDNLNTLKIKKEKEMVFDRNFCLIKRFIPGQIYAFNKNYFIFVENKRYSLRFTDKAIIPYKDKLNYFCSEETDSKKIGFFQLIKKDYNKYDFHLLKKNIDYQCPVLEIEITTPEKVEYDSNDFLIYHEKKKYSGQRHYTKIFFKKDGYVYSYRKELYEFLYVYEIIETNNIQKEFILRWKFRN